MAFLSKHTRGRGGWLLFTGLFASLLSSNFAQTPGREYQIKAVFLFNFAQFVDWPATTFSTPDTPLVIGILGEDPFGSLLDEVVRGEKAGSHPLAVQRYRSFAEVDCQILFISRSETARLDSLMAALADKPVLTVSDIGNSARRGVMIRFTNEGNRIHLRINLDSTRRAGLTVSSKLLRTAEVIGGKP